jgi:hypothetical protein
MEGLVVYTGSKNHPTPDGVSAPRADAPIRGRVPLFLALFLGASPPAAERQRLSIRRIRSFLRSPTSSAPALQLSRSRAEAPSSLGTATRTGSRVSRQAGPVRKTWRRGLNDGQEEDGDAINE